MPLGKYRSAAPVTLEEELAHSLTNPLVLGYTYRHLTTGDEGAMLGGFSTPFDIYIPLIREVWSEVYTAPDARYDYWPERLSYDLYRTEDLWYVLMRLSSTLTRSDFTGPVFTVVSEEHTGKLLQVCRRVQRERMDPSRDIATYTDRTLRPIYL